MKELHGIAAGVVDAPIEECVRFLQAVDRYPAWYPEVVRGVEVLDRDADGRPTRARAALHVSRGPLVRDFDLLLAIGVEPTTVTLTRLPHEPSDEERFEVTWRLEAGTETRLALRLEATLPIPRFLPVGGIGDAMAAGFVSAATRALG